MVRNAILLAGLVLGLATLITVHVALAGRIFLRQRPRWRGVVALFVPPLAIIWALRAGWRKIAVVWIGAIALYAMALIAALVTPSG